MECARREDGRRGEARSSLSSCARASRLLAPLRRPHSPHAVAGDHKQRLSHLSARHPEALGTPRCRPPQPRPPPQPRLSVRTNDVAGAGLDHHA
ncbi:hypothetical protein VPH35_081671 [Triticum aestivum]